MKTRTLIVDDELLARERMRQLLLQEPEIEIVGECSNGREAVLAIQKERSDLIFLDVQMPELDGFGVLQEIATGPMPVVVFVTAHDKFALRAFEFHAVDYLLKPFDRGRFQAALHRALEQVKHRQGGALDERLSNLLAELKSPPKSPERLAVKSGGRVVLVKIDDIDWIEAADNYVDLHVGKQSHLLREKLSTLEARLAPEKFVRISRSTIVNVERIKELQSLFRGAYTVILQNGERLTLSRSYRDKLKQFGLG
jgi:two-component system, LytTR family, response regulator